MGAARSTCLMTLPLFPYVLLIAAVTFVPKGKSETSTLFKGCQLQGREYSDSSVGPKRSFAIWPLQTSPRSNPKRLGQVLTYVMMPHATDHSASSAWDTSSLHTWMLPD